MPPSPISLVEFPADDVERARRFWEGLLAIQLEARGEGEGEGWQTRSDGTQIGVHVRGRGSGDTWSLPYFEVDDMAEALERVAALGGGVIHPGDPWSICRDSEGTPFALSSGRDASAAPPQP